MKRRDEERIAAQLAKAMAMICVRNTMLENLHAGRVPVTRTGDFSDVFVVDADGQHIPWAEVSRLDDDEMRDLMRQVVNRLYTFQICFGEPEFQAFVDRWLGVARKWDEPVLDPGLPGIIPPDAAD
ncbi:hypothetical protein CN884_04895 [Ochrobactrum sp. 30A/1000/2015]|uniref:hypothetical protein n=1 Tax=Agrobacterium pusense TaxID=648995 RepID=UPI000C28E56F|nr:MULTISPECIES: hypothetical protein [Brucella/Ochrobactrum group]PJT27719.1 hypothetical protein CN884_04895 [Ochrobactrum sp. 30A/1000/2015]PJT37849.1 hypothetical protein CN883_18035 [Ochrobactrum sp. 27A/999/2015]PJT42695.1 hypothetical protein CN882_16035 [Ochrobactrum sp. 23A/997/2015]